MEAKAILRSARISAQKVRLVADQVRGMPVGRATNLLDVQQQEGRAPGQEGAGVGDCQCRKQRGADVDELKVSKILVDEGPIAEAYACPRQRSWNTVSSSAPATSLWSWDE